MPNLIITAQNWENYSDNNEKPHWKPKGGSEFKIDIPVRYSVDMAYADNVKQACEEILREHSNDLYRYEYIEHELKFSEPIKVEYSSLFDKLKF